MRSWVAAAVVLAVSGRAEAVEGGGWRQTIAMPLRARLHEVLAGSARFPDAAAATLLAGSPDGSLGWYLTQVPIVLAFAGAAAAIALGIERWARARLLAGFPLGSPVSGPPRALPMRRADRIGFLLARALLELLAIGVFYTLMLSLVIGFTRHPASQALGEILAAVVALVWAVRAVLRAILAPGLPAYRPVVMSDEDARGLQRAVTASCALALTALGGCHLMLVLGLPLDAHVLSLLGTSLFGALLLAVVVHRYREAVARVILGPEPGAAGTPRRALARVWHGLAFAYLFLAWVVSSARLLLGLPSATGLVAGPLVVLLAALALYGLLLLGIDTVSVRRSRPVATEAPEGTPDAGRDTAPTAAPPGATGLERLAQHAAAAFVWIVALLSLLALWGVDFSRPGWAASGLQTVAIVFLGYLAYRATKIAIDRRIEDEGGPTIGEPGEEGGTSAASRLATLLPLFRNFMLITLVVITAMIALSQIGVDIAPLFAGAGIVGIAIGFGAQTLVRDIFSGAFFLIDDAFRVGEYLDIDGTRGTVERISVRSMQLRHHLGALHTIPFGEIKQLTNHSRDWATMKLELRLTYDTDVERVRKLIKQLGAELLEHPEVGTKFLQPLKSQGVLRMDDSAMIVRVKYMTRPGDQFVIRKLVFARIRELFEREGIRFAHREVTVRVAGNEPPAAAAGGAALRAIDGGSEAS